MTQPPSAPPASPTSPPVSAPVRGPGAGTPGTGAAEVQAVPQPGGARRTAWAEGVQRVRAAATTEPGRLRTIGAVLAVLLVLFGVVTAWQVADRKGSAVAVVEHSQPLSADAARIYRSLADANTTAASGFLAGGDEPRAVRQRYEKDIRDSAELLTTAAANSDNSRSARRQIATLNRQLPVYTGLVESARANDRRGLPLGGAYLRYADAKMRGELLPAARKLYTAETARLDRDYSDAKSWPFLAIGAGVLALGVLGWVQRRDYHRTNRVFNQGLLGATAATAAVLIWLVGGHALARSGLGESEETGARSLQALNETWISALQARGDENMTLVARGGGLVYEKSYQKQMASVTGTGTSGGLSHALSLADDREGRSAVEAAKKSVTTWKERHADARTQDDGGNYDDAVDKVIGAEKSTGESFDKVDESLKRASGHEQKQFTSAADDGLGWLRGLSVGAMVLAVLGAAAGVLGVGRRLGEYR